MRVQRISNRTTQTLAADDPKAVWHDADDNHYIRVKTQDGKANIVVMLTAGELMSLIGSVPAMAVGERIGHQKALDWLVTTRAALGLAETPSPSPSDS